MKELVAQSNMKEFDPECELHRPVLIIKAVDPGCTLELQIEDCITGKVIRLTTTDRDDMPEFEKAILEAFRAAWWNAGLVRLLWLQGTDDW
jgi:hypothetical protein